MPAEEARNLIQIEQQGFCPVCCNLDPYQAPPDTDRYSYPRTEYNIPAGTPVGKITIENSEHLLESLRRGCLYCGMVRTSLSGVHPGWEAEKSFIHLYLAPGLPVIVHLQFGATGSVAMGREEAMRELGVDLPEGQRMNLTYTLSEASKPPIDIEIYRPVLGLDETTVGDVVLAGLVQHMGAADEIPRHASDPKCFDFINDKVTNCMKDHTCERDGPLPLLPDRVIWIEANNATHIQLVEPKDIRAKYIALSYCWGPTSPDTYLTNASTLDARKAGIEYHDLPPLFQDVVSCSRSLGIEYLWIDRLCIIQGDGEDFMRQASKMNEIYGKATLTIAAASAASENDRILIERDSKWLPINLDMNINGIGSLKLRIRLRTHPLGTEYRGGNYGRISTRAWTWQERLLSGRTVFYTPSALKFECHRHSIWEGFGPGVTGNSWSAQLGNISHFSWTFLVEEYMSRDITRQSDRLPAMESVMKRIAQSQGWSPLWGMWVNALVQSLAWQSKASDRDGESACRMNPGRYAPTWSWASVDGPISYATSRSNGRQVASEAFVYNLEIRSVNAASGLIRVAGHAISVQLSCRVEVHEPEEANPTAERAFKYHYNVLGVTQSGGSYPVHPDVHLKPWTGNTSGPNLSTVVRVPHGETPPEQSWSATCLCLMVGKTRLRAEVLFLGGSMWESVAWERIGMVDGLHPDLFEGSQKQIIDII